MAQYGQATTPQQAPYGQQPAPYGYQQPAQQGWGGQPQPPPRIPEGVDPNIVQHFRQVDSDNSGDINADELRRALHNGFSPFNPETVRLMINMFDRDHSGTISLQEFIDLWKYIQDWIRTFRSFDRDNSGTIDYNEFAQALTSFRFNLPGQTVGLLFRKFDSNNNNNMKLDDFIQCIVMLQILTQQFQSESRGQPRVTLTYERYLEIVFSMRG